MNCIKIQMQIQDTIGACSCCGCNFIKFNKQTRATNCNRLCIKKKKVNNLYKLLNSVHLIETFCLATTFTSVLIPCKIYCINWVYLLSFSRVSPFHLLFLYIFCRFPIFWFFGFGCCMQLALPSFQYVAQKIIIIIYKRFCANQKLLPNCAKLNLLQLKTFIANFVCAFPVLFSSFLRVCLVCLLNENAA